jgi:hypothetical protein
MPREHEAGSRLEEEGIPDLQDGTPEQSWASDPQEMPLPGDEPVAANDYGTTIDEQLRGEPHDLRLSRERPDTPATEADEDVPENLYDPTVEHAGRLVAPDEGAHTDAEADLVAGEVGADGGGYLPEESAMHIVPDPEAELDPFDEPSERRG